MTERYAPEAKAWVAILSGIALAYFQPLAGAVLVASGLAYGAFISWQSEETSDIQKQLAELFALTRHAVQAHSVDSENVARRLSILEAAVGDKQAADAEKSHRQRLGL